MLIYSVLSAILCGCVTLKINKPSKWRNIEKANLFLCVFSILSAILLSKHYAKNQ